MVQEGGVPKQMGELRLEHNNRNGAALHSDDSTICLKMGVCLIFIVILVQERKLLFLILLIGL